MRIRVLLPLLLVGLVGCAADEEMPGLQLLGFYGLDAEEDGCSKTDEQISFGQYDTAIASEFGLPYVVYAHLRNGLTSNEDAASGQVDTHPVEVRSMHVAFEGEAWSALPMPIEVPVTGVLIGPGDEYWKLVEAIPPEAAAILESNFSGIDALSREVRVRLSFTGTTLDGTTVHSNELSFKVYACSGCFHLACGGGMLMGLCGMAGAQGDGVACLPPDSDT